MLSCIANKFISITLLLGLIFVKAKIHQDLRKIKCCLHGSASNSHRGFECLILIFHSWNTKWDIFFKLDYFQHIFFLQLGKREQSMQFTAQLCTYCILCVQIASPFFFLQKKIGVYFDPRACLIAMCQHNYGQRQLMNLYEQVWCCCFSHALRALAKSCSCCWQD